MLIQTNKLKSSIVWKIKHVLTNTYVSTSTSIGRIGKSLDQIKQENSRGEKIKIDGPYKQNTRSAIDTDIAVHSLEGLVDAHDEDAFVLMKYGKFYFLLISHPYWI